MNCAPEPETIKVLNLVTTPTGAAEITTQVIQDTLNYGRDWSL